jgi:hypothetical protein
VISVSSAVRRNVADIFVVNVSALANREVEHRNV